MKTIKIVIAALTVIFTVSCETHYKMVTRINHNGTVIREIYANADSTFMSGNMSKNPFFFVLSSDWNITRLDKPIKQKGVFTEDEFNVIITKNATSIEQYSKEIHCDKDKKSYAVPEESLSKRMGLFYTYYSFKAVYKKLEYEVPVSIDNYLTKEEQTLWTQGSRNSLSVLNGWEMNDNLDEINDKFMEWYLRNHFEISIECIKKQTTKYDLDTNKEGIYEQINPEVVLGNEMTPEIVCFALDTFYKTDYFSKLYAAKEEILNQDFESAISVKSNIGIVISYELAIPGEIIRTNAPITDWKSDLVWKVDGIRLLFDDYSLTAEYKVLNKWAVVITVLMLIVAVGSVFVLIKRKYF